MTTNMAQHRLRVANHFTDKLEEFRFHLDVIATACDISLTSFQAGAPTPEGNGRNLRYAFSSFTNSVQTLKDATSTFLTTPITWAEIRALRHGDFIKGSRNAITHDGHSVINGWADGKYFVAWKIVRLDDTGREVTINPPRTDVQTFCLEFAVDFVTLLMARLHQVQGDPSLIGSPFSMENLDEALGHPLVPEVGREVFAAHRSSIEARIASSGNDPIENAILKAEELVRYCQSSLASVQPIAA